MCVYNIGTLYMSLRALVSLVEFYMTGYQYLCACHFEYTVVDSHPPFLMFATEEIVRKIGLILEVVFGGGKSDYEEWKEQNKGRKASKSVSVAS